MSQRNDDPVLISARREALISVATWGLALAYSVGYCSYHGYNRKLEDLKYVYGFPDWVFWGVVVPWGVCVAFSWIFASIWMRDEELGEDPPGAEGADEFGLGG